MKHSELRSGLRVAAMAFVVACSSNDGETASASGSGSDGAETLADTSVSGTTSGSASESASGSASGSASSASSSADGTGTGASATGGDPCDCPNGAYVPVCGIDGMTYDATCGTRCVPVDIACHGECPCPEFMCGEEICAPGEVVCSGVVGGAADSGTTYACGPLPPQCDGVLDPDCACAGSVACDCVEGPPDYFRVTCYAP